jgi:hypothetical protein
VRQVIISSSHWARTKSNAAGASGKPNLSILPISVGTSALSVQKLLIPSVIVSARRTVCGAAATSNVKSTSPMAIYPFISAITKAYYHFSLE